MSALILAPNKNLITPLLVTSLPQSKIARQSQQYHRETPPPAPEAIALHGTEENFERVEKMSPEAFEESVDAIRLAALDLHAYWMAHPQEKAVQQPIKAESTILRRVTG